jgi:hypothetical protein
VTVRLKQPSDEQSLSHHSEQSNYWLCYETRKPVQNVSRIKTFHACQVVRESGTNQTEKQGVCASHRQQYEESAACAHESNRPKTDGIEIYGKAHNRNNQSDVVELGIHGV